jgi:hypothetical protein
MSCEAQDTGTADTLKPPAYYDPTTSTYRSTAAPAATRLDVLRALERGEIDIDEAARRLEEVGVDA